MRELILYYLPNVDTIFDTFFIRFGPMKLKLTCICIVKKKLCRESILNKCYHKYVPLFLKIITHKI